MRALVQRVSSASVDVKGVVVGQIERGMLVLLGVHERDTMEELTWVARKVVNLRIFPDPSHRMNASLKDVDGDILIVSQFTLYGDTRKGNRPSFNESASPELALDFYERFVNEVERLLGKTAATGEFGATMAVRLVNDGPVSILVEKHRD